MEAGISSTKRKRSMKKRLLWIVAILVIIVALAAGYVYKNFNRLLTTALMESFNSNLMSDVYELNFEKLNVNFLAGDVNVYNVVLQPREKPLHRYSYINSSCRLRTQKMSLENVEIMTLIKSHMLKLDKIEILEPAVDLVLDGNNYILFPFEDTTAAIAAENANEKKPVESFFLKEFGMINASFHVTNHAKLREFKIRKLNISVKDLLIDQRNKRTTISNKHFVVSMGEFTGSLQNKAVKHIDFKDYHTTIDSLSLQQTIDTSVYRFADFSTGLNMLDIIYFSNLAVLRYFWHAEPPGCEF